MKSFCTICLLFCLMASSPLFAQGTVIHEQFYSESLSRTQDVNVYLPEGYSSDSVDVLYPVIYLLHGGGVNYTYYSEIVPALDSLIGNEIEPVILVRPDGFYGPYSGMTWWSNSELNGNFEDYVTVDLVNFIESNYNAGRERSKRFIMGHSMGGYGAMMIALKHTDLYCGVVSFSGVVNSTFTVQNYYFPEMFTENGGGGPYVPSAGGYSTVVFSLAAAFTPNLDNPPYNLDLPIDDNGEIIEEVFEQWIHEDPSWLATQLDPEDSIAIYIDALDGEAFPVINQAFADTLDLYDLPYTMRFFPGRDHHRDLPQRYPAALAFADSVMHILNDNDVRENDISISDNFKFSSVYPNPFNQSARITIWLPIASDIKVSLINVLGEELCLLAEGTFEKGYHRFDLKDNGLATGIYLIRAAVAGRGNLIRKVALIR